MRGNRFCLLIVLLLIANLLAACQPIQPPNEVEVASAVVDAELTQALAGAYKGASVTIGGPWDSDIEPWLLGSFRKEFEAQTGIAVTYTHLSESELAITAALDTETMPDLMEFMSPAPAMHWAAAGRLVGLAQIVPIETLRARLAPGWLDWVTTNVAGKPFVTGFPNHYYLSGVIWYPKAAFDAAGYKVPATWDELIALSDQIVADGGKPWCLQNGFWGGNTVGTPSAIWVEQIMLHTTSAETNAQWTRGDLKFDSPEVRNAIELMGQVWFNPDYPFVARAKLNTISQGIWNYSMARAQPACWLMLEPNWMTANAELPGTFGSDYAFFEFPVVNPAIGNPQLVEAHFISMFSDRPEVRALMQHISKGAQVETWLKNAQGTPMDVVISTQATPPDWLYPSARDQATLALVANANRLGYDAMGLMPTAESNAFVKAMADLVAGTIDIDTAVQRIDAARVEAGD